MAEKVIFCTEPHCRLPVGRIVNSKLQITSKHHGEKHTASIPFTDLLKLISDAEGINLLTEPGIVAKLCAESAE